LLNKLNFTSVTCFVGLLLLNKLNFAPDTYFVHLVLPNKPNITSGTYFVDLAFGNVSVVLPEFGPLAAETYWSNRELIKCF
jgi:hypothetical protein